MGQARRSALKEKFCKHRVDNPMVYTLCPVCFQRIAYAFGCRCGPTVVKTVECRVSGRAAFFENFLYARALEKVCEKPDTTRHPDTNSNFSFPGGSKAKPARC